MSIPLFPTLLDPRILHPELYEVRRHARRCQTQESQENPVASLVKRRILGQKCKCRYDAPNIPKANLPGRPQPARQVSLEIHREPTYHHWHRRVGAHGDEEKRAVFEGSVVMRRFQDCNAGDGDADACQREEEPMGYPVRQYSNQDREDKSCSGGRDAV